MTYLDLIRDADRQLDDGRITIGEYEQMIEPMNREVHPEIIRCKDCKFSHMTNDGRYCKYCDQFTDTDDYGELVEMYFDSDFYCGYAERRTDG